MNTTSYNPESPLHIVFASDQRFLRQLTVASGSAVYASRASGGRICLHVLDCGIEDPSWTNYAALIDRVAAKAHVEVALVRHVVDMARMNHLQGWTNGSKAIWARLLIPELLPDVDQCIYSDCDMLFVADPAEMLDSLQDPKVLLSGPFDIYDTRRKDADWCRDRGLPVNMDDYICSGLIAMNLKGFREEGITEKCFDFGLRHSNIPFPNQTTMNQVCFGRKALLPDGWGVLYPKECPSFTGRIKSIHYAGCRFWPWETCRTWHNVALLTIAKEAYAIWLDFETRILGLSPLGAMPALRLRLVAAGLLLMARVATRLGIQVGRGRLQSEVAEHKRKTPALSNARREVLGEDGTHTLSNCRF